MGQITWILWTLDLDNLGAEVMEGVLAAGPPLSVVLGADKPVADHSKVDQEEEGGHKEGER